MGGNRSKQPGEIVFTPAIKIGGQAFSTAIHGCLRGNQLNFTHPCKSTDKNPQIQFPLSV